ncbi:MAG: hypothetical protein J3R72DRAFT_139216 [Linnemannia gamsii]|nr:MAG: hypothetical protein J3R72DRAFT_139216 [Linnemannia gamsii]
MLLDRLSEALQCFPEVFGRLEVGLALDEFSKQRNSLKDWNDDELKARLGLSSYPEAFVIVLKAVMIARRVGYQGFCGYDPERIREIAKSSCWPSDFEGPSSKLLRAHNMGEYGSGGLPEFVREAQKNNRMDSALRLERLAQIYIGPGWAGGTPPFFKAVQELKERSVDFGMLAWCRAAISIEMCRSVLTVVNRTWRDWLLKLIVHAACTLERAQSGELESSLAAFTLFWLCREIAYGLHCFLNREQVSSETAAITSTLIDAGHGFISAGLCQTFTEQIDEKYAGLMLGLAMESRFIILGVVSGTTFGKSTEWRKLAKKCIKLTNFCPGRSPLNLDIRQRDLFHLIARAEHITTSRKLHSTCGDTCVHAFSTANHNQAGHLDEGCQCQTKDFSSIETSDLVLFDTWNQELLMAKPDFCYVAVSQVWFQGIFGQASRKCGKCSLDYLTMTCRNIGVRYAWIDTLCMPSGMDLRREVIGQLRNIYLNAEATLVVDVGLISTAARTVLDLSLAIWMSDWSSRVWTLQEGVLASKLLFCVEKQVHALPRGYHPLDMLSAQQVVPASILSFYGARDSLLDLPTGGQGGTVWALEALLQMAAGRQTSYPCDYLYGLSALLPSTPDNRDRGPDQVAIEVAQMYGSVAGVDLGILTTSYDRCKTEGYRWMPLGARTMVGYSKCNVTGRLGNGPGGLRCQIKALIKLTSVVNICSQNAESQFWATRATYVAPESIIYWYSTEMTDVFVGTSVRADNLVCCLVGDINDPASRGFVVSPTMFHGRHAYQYIGTASVIGKVSGSPSDILVT